MAISAARQASIDAEIAAAEIAPRTSGAPRRASLLAGRVCLTLVLGWASLLAARDAISAFYARHGTEADLSRAIHWAPSNAANFMTLARLLRQSPENLDLHRVLDLEQRATSLEPGRASYWAELADTEDWAGRTAGAEREFDRALSLFPLSPGINWQAGNFHLGRGNAAAALSEFSVALKGDPALRRPAFGVVTRAGIPVERVLANMAGGDAGILLAYLDALREAGRLDQARTVWAALLARGGLPSPQAAFPYVDALLTAERGEEAGEVWDALVPAESRARRSSAPGGERIRNGSFELPVLDGGLDWRVYPVEGAAARIVTSTAAAGPRALEIDFDSRDNLAYRHAFQFVPVAPGAAYEFRGKMRTLDVTSDSGVRFEISDAIHPERLDVSTAGVTGTTPWTAYSLRFRTGPDTHVVIVRIARPSSESLDHRFSGSAWIDDVSLAAAAK